MYNLIMEWIHQVLGNLARTCNITQTYVDKDDPCLFILAAAALGILLAKNRLNGYIPVQLVFGSDIILLIKHKVDWELIRQQKQTQINKDNICENRKKVEHNYKVGDKFILNNNAAHKFETPYKGPFVINGCWNNGMVTLQCDKK